MATDKLVDFDHVTDYISREAAIKAAKAHYPKANEMIAGIILVPAADVVARDCYDRILAENDTMRDMLARIGKKCGDSMDDVRPANKRRVSVVLGKRNEGGLTMATDKLVDFDHVTDYISREAALSCFHDWIDRYGHEHTADEMVEYQRIEELPAADVVEVVRCKDCKYYTDGKLLGPTKFCYFYKIGTGLNTADDDFCSKGERREPNLDTTKGERRDESSG